ncbi:MAG: hypothetical protein KJN77_00125 [Gammaproteobacteria bacterium]|nr:hypothetical protein [Gammaproteobacteria bacterium]
MMFGNEATVKTENDKLVDLFRNRIELKKEFAALRNEKYQLEDSIKRHLDNIVRVEQKLGHLESLLLDPEWVHSVATFYQLKAVADRCHKQLKHFAEQLKRKREKQQYAQILAVWQQRRREKVADLQHKLDEHRVSMQRLENELDAARSRLVNMGLFTKWLRGRLAAQDIDAVVARIETGQVVEEEMLLELQHSEDMLPPTPEGLDIASKRQINFQILAFAQHLYLHYETENLTQLVKEASEKSVGTIGYGDKAECNRIMECIAERTRSERPVGDLAEDLARRADLIAGTASFQRNEDVMPEPSSVATVFDFDLDGELIEIDAAILSDNFFGVRRILSR